ncbi:MAG: hypothetical protein Q7T51_01240 [Candidatus Moranbacteria bacterium]|nr:hypothetical protein [Candidatus Moranbacteria bacterium]
MEQWTPQNLITQEKRNAEADKLSRKGAKLVMDEGADKPRLDLTPEQKNAAEDEMHEDFEQQEQWMREARTGLTEEFLNRMKRLEKAIATRTREAVVIGDFTDLRKIIDSVSRDITRLEKEYNDHWKDLGPDKK